MHKASARGASCAVRVAARLHSIGTKGRTRVQGRGSLCNLAELPPLSQAVRCESLKGELGICESSSRVKMAAAHAHFGEEGPFGGTVRVGDYLLQQVQLALRLLSKLADQP